MNLLGLIRRRRSSRELFDPERRIPPEDMRAILEAARWAPTAHNMQNFQIIVVEDRAVLGEIAGIPTAVSQTFLDESYAQLSFSEEELRMKKVGLLGAMFPPSWRTPGKRPQLEDNGEPSHLGAPILRTSALLVVLYDASTRAPASEHDALGMMSLGCVMENMWLTATFLGIGFHVQSALAVPSVEAELRRVLHFPPELAIAFGVRLGYAPGAAPTVRVRREVADFAHYNVFSQPKGSRPES